MSFPSNFILDLSFRYGSSAFSGLFPTETKQKLTSLYNLSTKTHNLFGFMPYGGGFLLPQQTVMEQVTFAADSWHVSLVFTFVVMK